MTSLPPGKELDALVAKSVFGFDLCTCDHEALRVSFYKKRREKELDMNMGLRQSIYSPFGSDNKCNTCGREYKARPYSTDISSAFSVFDVLRKVHSTCHLGIQEVDGKWRVIYGYHDDRGPDGETAPHAICLEAMNAPWIIKTGA